ncbi:MAG: NADH-quinone oxidoreductase subunit C [Thermodesulfovibrio sp.]
MRQITENIINLTNKIETIDENLIIHANPFQIKEIAKLLVMQQARFIHLTAIDFITQKNQIELNYFFSLIDYRMNIIVKTSLEPSDPTISSIAEIIPAAVWAERECNDLFGIKFEGHPDPRKLVLPDDWPDGIHPLRKNFSYNSKPPKSKQPSLLKKPEEGKTVIPIGPFYPSLEEPAYFRLIVDGEEIVDFDYRGFYVHRGIEKLAESALNYQQIPFLAERICGICGFVHSCAYCQAVEKAAQIEIPLRAKFIRSMFLELERLHSHLLWVGLAAHIVGFDTLFMQA